LVKGKAAVLGGVSGALSFGIGQITTGMSIIEKVAMQAALHGTKGGLMSSIDGGSFESGFAAGAVSSLVASGIEALGGLGGYYTDDDYSNWSNFASRNPAALKAAMIASGGLSGGLSSSIAGGSFADGFRQGVITSGLNHGMHGAWKVPLQTKQNIDFNKLESAYPGDEYSQVSSKKAFTDVGGDVKKFYDDYFLKYNEHPNACALRLSIAFNDSGHNLNYVKGATFKGSNGKYYFLSAEKMATNLGKQFNLTPIITRDSSLISFSGLKGIYFMQPKLPSSFGATGHISIWNGKNVLGGHSYSNHVQFYQATLFR
jgi:hypothetical protein